MPHADARACVDAAVSACPQLPFWPTRPLAVAAEEMIHQWSSGLPGVGERLDWVGRAHAPGSPGLPAEAVGTLEPFLRVLGQRPGGWLKLQATGPVTLALALDAGGHQALTVPSARGPLAVGYAARIRSLVTRVREALPGWRVVLVLDEPWLSHPLVADRPRLALELWRGLGSTGADVTGLHCCAPPPWGLVLELDPQLVSFDALRDGDAATDDPAFRRLVEGGAAVAWGLLPADGAADAAAGGAEGAGAPADGSGDLEAIAERLLDLVEWTAGDYLPEVLARSLVTPTCGLASLAGAEACRRLALAATVGARAWSLADLP